MRGQGSAPRCCCFRKGELTDRIFLNTVADKCTSLPTKMDCCSCTIKTFFPYLFIFFTASLFYWPQIHPIVYSHEQEESATKSSTLIDGFMMSCFGLALHTKMSGQAHTRVQRDVLWIYLTRTGQEGRYWRRPICSTLADYQQTPGARRWKRSLGRSAGVPTKRRRVGAAQTCEM